MTQKQKLPTKIKRVSGETVHILRTAEGGSVFPLAVYNSRCYLYGLWRLTGALPQSLVLFRCYCRFVCPTKHIKAPAPCIFVQFAVASSVPQSTKKHQHCFFVQLRSNKVSHCCVFASPAPSTHRAFGAFSLLLWFRLGHKVQTLCFSCTRSK